MKLRTEFLVSRLTSSSSQHTALAATAALATAAGYTFFIPTTAKSDADNGSSNSSSSQNKSYQIETDFMDRLGQKPYLESCNLPKRLRVLAVDVPEMRHAFDGECRLNLSKVYADGIAPPKTVKVGNTNDDGDNNNNNNNKEDKEQQQSKKEEQQQQHNLHVIQKSFAKSFIKCRKEKRIGVELLEASIADLNPNNLRKMHHFMHHRFDPGKYAAGGGGSGKENSEQKDGQESKTDERNATRNDSSRQQRTVVLATEEDELDAPWNQYAWMEELELRLSGKVPFGGELTAANRLQRLWNGNAYKSTIPSSRAWWEWCLPPWFHRDPAGTDGNSNRAWASHRPHAVIANGAALQRVPGSLRFLQRACTDIGVPLFVVNDPRVWGGNTHMKMDDALRDLRKTVKHRCMSKCLGQTSAFARGRIIGNMETEFMWQARDAGRKTREAIESVNRKMTEEKHQDWSELSGDELAQKLSRHKVLKERWRNATEYSEGMKELITKCMKDFEPVKEKEAQSRPTKGDGPSKQEPPPILSAANAEPPSPQQGAMASTM